MPFSLPDLPFDPETLSPWTSAETFSFHHGKHHAAYVDKLNAAIEGGELADKSLEEIIAATRGQDPGVFNNAAQAWNHEMFWQSLAAEAGDPGERLTEMLERDFGSVDEFKKTFDAAALSLFGSGWCWLVQTADGQLEVRQYGNAETPGGSDDRGLLPLDVWEHSYYIDHRNNRGSFVAGFWSHVNWAAVEERLG